MVSWSARKNPITGLGAGVSVAGGGASVGGTAVGCVVGGAMVAMAVAVGLVSVVGEGEAGGHGSAVVGHQRKGKLAAVHLFQTPLQEFSHDELNGPGGAGIAKYVAPRALLVHVCNDLTL